MLFSGQTKSSENSHQIKYNLNFFIFIFIFTLFYFTLLYWFMSMYGKTNNLNFYVVKFFKLVLSLRQKTVRKVKSNFYSQKTQDQILALLCACCVISKPQFADQLNWDKYQTSVFWVNASKCVQFSSVQFISVARSCLTLCNPMNRSTPGLPVYHQLPEFTQTHVYWISDAIQPSHPLSSPSPPAPNPSQHHSLFQWVSSSHEVAKVLEFQL